jgi:hypothetical protein
VERLVGHQLRHRICQLDLAACAGLALAQRREYLRLEYVPAADEKIRRRVRRGRLLDHPGHLRQPPCRSSTATMPYLWVSSGGQGSTITMLPPSVSS